MSIIIENQGPEPEDEHVHTWVFDPYLQPGSRTIRVNGSAIGGMDDARMRIPPHVRMADMVMGKLITECGLQAQIPVDVVDRGGYVDGNVYGLPPDELHMIPYYDLVDDAVFGPRGLTYPESDGDLREEKSWESSLRQFENEVTTVFVEGPETSPCITVECTDGLARPFTAVLGKSLI